MMKSQKQSMCPRPDRVYNLRIINGRKRGSNYETSLSHIFKGGRSAVNLLSVLESLCGSSDELKVFQCMELSDHCKIVNRIQKSLRVNHTI